MIRTYSFSEAGGHPVNEDAFTLQRLPQDAGWLVALADGQGGRAGGAHAAQTACRIAVERLLAGSDLTESLLAADVAVARDREAGFTTLVGLCVKDNRVFGASCGDCAALAVGKGGLMRILTSRQFKNPPVGSGEATFVPFDLELGAPWRILVMSDGVWKYASWEKVCDCAAKLSGDQLIAALQEAARLKATGEFQDDFTVALLESE